MRGLRQLYAVLADGPAVSSGLWVLGDFADLAIVDYIDEERGARPSHIFRLCAMAEKPIPVDEAADKGGKGGVLGTNETNETNGANGVCALIRLANAFSV